LTLGLEGFSSKMEANNYNRNFMLWGSKIMGDDKNDAGVITRPGQAPLPGYVVKDGVLTNANFAGVAGTPYAVYDMIYREATAK
ncbi:hypothetical protein, partial [Enterobacter hormaechei]